MTAQRIYLIGAGMGTMGTLTLDALQAIEGSQLLIGAQRLLDAFPDAPCEKRALVRTAEIADALEATDAVQVSVLFSGDSGFYSGAIPLLKEASRRGLSDTARIEVLPGISSLQYFCAQIGKSWDNAFISSVHGRTCDFVDGLRRMGKALLLTGGAIKAHDVCAQLAAAGFGDARVWVGENLSYETQRLVSSTAAELAQQEFVDLAVMLVERADGASPNVGACETPAPRVLIAAPRSGSGKTTFVCGLLRALQRRGLAPLACKCGPDYIDPMFHRNVIGTASRNIDLFFADGNQARALLARDAAACDITVIEGAMGYYDGIALSDTASAWDVARTTATPTILLVDARGAARSVVAEVLGFYALRPDSCIAGVVLNKVSASLYPQLKAAIEAACNVQVLGFVPKLEGAVLESRHLGLVTADEVADLDARVDMVADAVQEHVDLDALIALAQAAEPLRYDESPALPLVEGAPRIAVARDEAFCFYYADTIRLFAQLGAQIVEFSPLHDAALPEGVAGLYLGGGYPELHAQQLSANESMRESIRTAIAAGLPTIAECGGFLYLHETLEDADGIAYPQVSALPARAFKTDKLGRFGYITLTAQRESMLGEAGAQVRGHEFHYWESEQPGDAFAAQKPQSKRGWQCGIATDTLYAGFPHLYLPANPQMALRFVQKCAHWQLCHDVERGEAV